MTRTGVNEDTVALTVNGDRLEVQRGSTLATVLRSLSLDPRMVVVEHNRVILHDRERFDDVRLGSGDTLEIVHFVGGG
jgi:thiazole synthase